MKSEIEYVLNCAIDSWQSGDIGNIANEDEGTFGEYARRALEDRGLVIVRRETAGVSRVAVKAKLKSGYVSNGSARYQRAYDDLRAALERKATK